MLRFYYDDKTIKNFESLFKNEKLNTQFQNQIRTIVEKYIVPTINISEFIDLKNFENYYKINKNAEIYSIRNKCLIKKYTKPYGTAVILQNKTYYIHELLSLNFET